jgi:hypothetical protein
MENQQGVILLLVCSTRIFGFVVLICRRNELENESRILEYVISIKKSLAIRLVAHQMKWLPELLQYIQMNRCVLLSYLCCLCTAMKWKASEVHTRIYKHLQRLACCSECSTASCLNSKWIVNFLSVSYGVAKGLLTTFPMFPIPIGLGNHNTSIPTFFLFLCFSYPMFQRGPESSGTKLTFGAKFRDQNGYFAFRCTKIHRQQQVESKCLL